MLKDITLGQYFPGSSFVHRMDPRFKIVIVLLYIIMLFTGKSLLCMLFGILFCILSFGLSKLSPKLVLKSVKPIVPILLCTAILDLLFIRDGTVYLSVWVIRITAEGVTTAVQMLVRIVFLIIGTSLLTYTTSPIALTDAIERLLSPLKKLKFPVHVFAMMMTIALRFVPTLLEETDKIMNAQKARGADMESGGLISRVKALVPVLIPLFVSSFRRAYDLAMAMECRCYNGGKGRTKMKVLHIEKRDIVVCVITAAVCLGVILLNAFIQEQFLI